MFSKWPLQIPGFGRFVLMPVLLSSLAKLFLFQVWAESNWASGFGLSAFVVENSSSELWVLRMMY